MSNKEMIQFGALFCVVHVDLVWWNSVEYRNNIFLRVVKDKETMGLEEYSTCVRKPG